MNLILKIILLTFIAFGLKAQNPSADFKKINLAFLNTNFSADTKYSLYKNTTDKIALQTETGYYKYNAISHKSIMKLGEYTILSSNEYTLTVNSEEKEILFSKIQKKKSGNDISMSNTEVVLMLVDTLVKYSKGIQYKQINDNEGEYLFIPGYGEYSKVRIRFSLKNYLITELEFFYKKNYKYLDKTGKEAKPRLEIFYSNIIVNPGFNNDDFSYNKYISEKGGELILTPEYKYYKLTAN